MGERSSLWGYDEFGDIERLRQKLLFTALELEKFKTQVEEEKRKNKEVVNQMIQLLKFAVKERDEAKNQIQYLTQTTNNLTTTPHFRPNSTLTESSNALSETYTSVDSLFDSVPSPEFSNVNLLSNRNLIRESNGLPLSYTHVPTIDDESLIIDNLARGKILPRQGKLLQAVLESGPLLQTLFVSGPLPKWRVPPPVQKVTPSIRPTVTSQPYAQMSCGSNPMLNFANDAASGSLSSGIDTSTYGSFGKRQRLC